jgi:hypothetical protein
MKEFVASAQRAQRDDGEEPDRLEFTIDGVEFSCEIPTSAQIALMASAADEGGATMVNAVFNFLRGIMYDEEFLRLRRLVSRGKIDFDIIFGGNDDNEVGVVDWIIEEAADRTRPTGPSTGSSESRGSGGRRSTGRSHSRASTRGGSPSPAS